jgi:hypothetical protein
MFRVYMTPPFDRTTNGNMRSRVLWGVRDHEDDRHYLATRFEEALRNHAALSDEAVLQADLAYRQLTNVAPPNAADYALRGLFLVMVQDRDARSPEESKQRLTRRLGGARHLLEIKVLETDGRITPVAVVRGLAGRQWLIEELQKEPKMAVSFAEPLTRELINQAGTDVLRDFERLLPASR